MNNPKPVHHTVVSHWYENAVWAMEEEKDILTFIYESAWSVEMATLKNSMVRCTDLHEVVEEKQGSDRTGLPCLREVYREHYPYRADERLGTMSNKWLYISALLRKQEKSPSA